MSGRSSVDTVKTLLYFITQNNEAQIYSLLSFSILAPPLSLSLYLFLHTLTCTNTHTRPFTGFHAAHTVKLRNLSAADFCLPYRFRRLFAAHLQIFATAFSSCLPYNWSPPSFQIYRSVLPGSRSVSNSQPFFHIYRSAQILAFSGILSGIFAVRVSHLGFLHLQVGYSHRVFLSAWILPAVTVLHSQYTVGYLQLTICRHQFCNGCTRE